MSVEAQQGMTIETATGGNVGSFGVADAMAVAAVDGPLGPQRVEHVAGQVVIYGMYHLPLYKEVAYQYKNK